jgi:hypothetical protein
MGNLICGHRTKKLEPLGKSNFGVEFNNTRT